MSAVGREAGPAPGERDGGQRGGQQAPPQAHQAGPHTVVTTRIGLEVPTGVFL